MPDASGESASSSSDKRGEGMRSSSSASEVRRRRVRTEESEERLLSLPQASDALSLSSAPSAAVRAEGGALSPARLASDVSLPSGALVSPSEALRVSASPSDITLRRWRVHSNRRRRQRDELFSSNV